MIYIQLDHLADIMKLAERSTTETVYQVNLGGSMAYWRITISVFSTDSSDNSCFTFSTTGARLLVELGLVKEIMRLDQRPPQYEEMVPGLQGLAFEERDRAISRWWLPRVEEAIIKLDLETLATEGTVMTPDTWGRYGEI